jgi:hypothetical protein
MVPKPRDPLLAAARIILILMMASMAIAAIACAALVPLAPLLFKDKLVPALLGQGFPPETFSLLLVVAGILAICAALGFVFFRNLYRIVGSVADGEPFTPVNAERLSGMGWIVVAVHIAMLPLAGIAAWVARHAEALKIDDHIHVDGGFDLGGILLALILFILARVFREGARMREELEGTV